MLLLFLTVAHAAEVTRLPAALGVDLRVGYAAHFEAGPLEEAEARVGRRTVDRHTFSYTAEFAPIDGLAFHLALDQTPWQRLAYAETHAMVYDPVGDTGTLQGGSLKGGDLLDPQPERIGGGLEGLWIGVAGAPFVERTGAPGTWRLDLAWRSPAPRQTFWTSDGDRRGVAPGGTAWRLGAAFSTTNAPADAYLVGQYQIEGTAQVPVTDDAGATLATRSLRPANRLDLRAGVEIDAGTVAGTDERFAFDLFLGLGHRSAARLPSGVVLPDVLDRTQGTLVDHPPHLLGTAGLGAIVEANEWFVARIAGTAAVVLPHRLEAPYPVRAGLGTHAFGVEGSIEARLR